MKINLTAIVLLTAGLLAGCNDTNRNIDNAGDVRELAAEDTAVMYDENNVMAGSAADEEEYSNVDFNAPEVEDAELRNAGVGVRGADNYFIYSVSKDVMFEADQAEISNLGEERLQAIVNAINEQDMNGSIRVYGFTDASAGAANNEGLSRERAVAVEEWLRNNSDLDTNRMRVVSMGQRDLEPANQTTEDRSIEIVVINRNQNQ